MSFNLDRASHLREDDLDELWANQETRAIVFRSGHPLMDEDRLASLPAASLTSEDRTRSTFLGTVGGAPRFLVDLDDEGWNRLASLWRTAPTASTFREAAPRVGAEDAEMLAFAQGLVNWHERSGFCPRCGSPATLGRAGHARVCSSDSCGAETFPRIDPVVIMLVTRGDELLLVRHRRARSSVFFSAIAGFVEHGETLEAAVARETLEEVGLEIASVRYFGSQAWPMPTSLMVGFTAVARDGEVRVDEKELVEARWFTREALRAGEANLAPRFSIARRMIDAWMEGGGQGRPRA